ncbi:TetR/AcrR family transcriptional regulator [Mycobacterium sp.]|uniref:TetR/AcrR family transcriptional regulator n=1 Tax=Mycobacterium sp. TaxID=1785 RepID=UPI002C68BD33|nr:TetR/AcrR family transcriptional regulator [Mycobacterium sp.]HTQ17000.1 TetR/AcrR family transcriptional regulator [Mycobacterium sp.]
MTTRQSELQARRRAHRRDARRRLLDAAHGLLEEKPWAEISLDDITSTAQVARTAFYRHFEDRQHLLMAMLDDVGLELDHVADDWMADADDPVAELRRSLDGLTSVFVEHGRLIQAISDTARRDPEIGALYLALADRLAANTARRIEADIAAGRCRLAEPGEVARALTWMNERYLLACFGQRPFSDRVPHQKEAAAALTTVWINTLYGAPPATEQ